MKRRMLINVPLGPDKKNPVKVLEEGRVYTFPSETWAAMADQMGKTLPEVSREVAESEAAEHDLSALTAKVEELEAEVARLASLVAPLDAPPADKPSKNGKGKKGGKG